MRKYILFIMLLVSVLFVAPVKSYALGCQPGNPLLGFPTWYQYMDCDSDTGKPTFRKDANGNFNPQDILLIGMAFVVILMRLAGILAVVFVVIGGIKYTTSQGNPEGVQNAKNTIVNALIGLVLTFLASGIVSFIARSVH